MDQYQANINSLRQHVAFLTELQPARNYRNLASLNKAAAYIHTKYSALGFDVVEYQPFKVRGGVTYQNISAIIRGKSSERIVVGAHYDVWGDLPGADDNASAVAGLLETARLIGNFRKQQQPAYTLEFVGYCLEEPPFFATDEMGSAVHARELHNSKTALKLMVCYEMIGYFSDKAGSQGFPHPSLKEVYPDKGNFIIVGGHSSQPEISHNFAALMQTACNIPVYPVASPLTDGPVNAVNLRLM
jgi:hypothetical protein